MFKTKRSRVRAVAAVGMVAVIATVGGVTYQASAGEAPGARAVSVPLIAEAIKPPPGSIPIGAYLVQTGTQTYTCNSTATGTAFGPASVPEARLIGTGGRIHHFGGPSWQSERDGSLVTATKAGESLRPGTIAELLLKVATHTGNGILSKADFINRLRTSGGTAPAGACTLGTTAVVPYKAIYVFWDAPA